MIISLRRSVSFSSLCIKYWSGSDVESLIFNELVLYVPSPFPSLAGGLRVWRTGAVPGPAERLREHDPDGGGEHGRLVARVQYSWHRCESRWTVCTGMHWSSAHSFGKLKLPLGCRFVVFPRNTPNLLYWVLECGCWLVLSFFFSIKPARTVNVWPGSLMWGYKV